ncbi:MAG: 3-phosphoserine/phosphohydroxythreonine transaminase [Legionella sp.]
MTTRSYNFGAGPAMLPEPVLRAAQRELLDWQHLGLSVLEVGHRTTAFTELLADAERSLRALLFIPANYKVLFLGGAARSQFAMIPMNLLAPDAEAAYLVTGIWSQMAFDEAQRLKQAVCLANDLTSQYLTVPEPKSWTINKDYSYLYYTPNETVNGVRFPYVPKSGSIPLIADMTSCLLSEPIDVRDYGLIFAGAQKNIANAGLTLVIIREDLLEQAPNPTIATMLQYKTHADHQSLYATPPVFNCYLAAKMFDWVKQQGGVEVLFRLNCEKAAKLYQYLDSTEFYQTSVDPQARSLMNICFKLYDSALEPEFLSTAEQRGLLALKGHRMVGGLRASIYNAMPMAGIDALIDFMTDFAREH